MNICPFSKYSDIFGKPGEGVHSYRILGSPIVDYIVTLVFAGIITFFSGIPLVLTTIVLFILGVILHILFGVETATTKFLGLTCKK